MGIITSILRILIIIILVTALIFSIYLFGKDITHIREVINETQSNNGTCNFNWKGFYINCSYKESHCFINGTQEISCKNEND